VQAPYLLIAIVNCKGVGKSKVCSQDRAKTVRTKMSCVTAGLNLFGTIIAFGGAIATVNPWAIGAGSFFVAGSISGARNC
jgi:hypothetical protein